MTYKQILKDLKLNNMSYKKVKKVLKKQVSKKELDLKAARKALRGIKTEKEANKNG